MFDHIITWLLSISCKAVISLRDAVTVLILSLTTNHVFSLHSLDLVFLSNDPDFGITFDGACCFC